MAQQRVRQGVWMAAVVVAAVGGGFIGEHLGGKPTLLAPPPARIEVVEREVIHVVTKPAPRPRNDAWLWQGLSKQGATLRCEPVAIK